MIGWSYYTGFIGGLITLVFVLRWNITYLGINDVVFIIFTSLITDSLSQTFSFLPSLVLFAKVTPPHVEATVFSLLTGINNFANFFVSPMMGLLINNLFVGVSNSSLNNMYILIIIQLSLVLTPLFIINLIPTKQALHDF